MCRRKQAHMKLLHPHITRRVPLFEANSTHSSNNEAYSIQRHTYLVTKIGDLSRKQRAIALRHDKHIASVSDCIAAEKRSMLNQIFDLEREEV
jgi:hypothetical protein